MSLTVLGWLGLLLSPDAAHRWVWAPPLLMGLCLEVSAPRLGAFGYFSCAFGAWLAVLLDPQGGSSLIALAILTSLLLRYFLNEKTYGARLIVADFGPSVMALFAAACASKMDLGWVVAMLTGQVSYLLLTHLVQSALFQGSQQEQESLSYLRGWTGYQRLAEVFAGTLTVALGRIGSNWSLLVWPLLWAVRRSARADWLHMGVLE